MKDFILNPLLIGFIVFFSLSAYFRFKKWLLIKNYKYRIKGEIVEIKIINKKLFFIIKWLTPVDFKEKSTLNIATKNINFFNHYIKDIPASFDAKETEKEINKYINKFLKKSFYLQAKVEKGVIVEVVPLEKPFFFLWVNISFLIALIILYSYLN